MTTEQVFIRITPESFGAHLQKDVCLIGKLDQDGVQLTTGQGKVTVQNYLDCGPFENNERFVEIRGTVTGPNTIDFKSGNAIPGDAIELNQYYEAVKLNAQV